MKDRSLHKRIAAGLCACLAAGFVGSANCASLSDFETKEYRNGMGLAIIHAADAYALGYTGAGVTLGICDDYVKFGHTEFANKKAPVVVGVLPSDYDWTKYDHGSHVAGTMAAAKDGKGMHGLAFDAELVSGTYDKDDGMAIYQALKENVQVKIINNSWGYPNYSDAKKWTRDDIDQVFSSEGILFFDIMEQSIVQDDKVLVFAAGNLGHTAPSTSSMLSYVRPAAAGSFINVTSVDPEQYSLDKSVAGSAFISIFSDLTKYVEENSIAAPGSAIYSVSAGDDGYTQMYGTSMAAPHVSAAAGLVQQAFPYMDAKMLTDTVLSSANADFKLPDFMLTVQEDGDRKRINLYYFEGNQNTSADDLAQYYDENQWIIEGFYGLDQNAWLSLPIHIYENVPREMLFGQGLLDVGAAVRGPGLLNARRIDRTNLSEAYGGPQALYAVDTRGWNSVWSNDIGEKRAGLLAENSAYEDLRKIYSYYLQNDALNGFSFGQQYIDDYNRKVAAAGLQDLPVGLHKQGLGTLTLTGDNTYSGASVVTDGVLQIDGSVAGDAYSAAQGTIGGVGTIKGDLHNAGVVRAGSTKTEKKGLTLTVNGDFSGGGAIAVAVQEGENGLIDVAGKSQIDQMTFAAAPDSIYVAEKNYTFLQSGGGIEGTFANSALTGMLSAQGQIDIAKQNAAMHVFRQNNMTRLGERQLRMYGAMESMYDALGEKQRAMDTLYNLSTADATRAMRDLYAATPVNLAAATQRNTLFAEAMESRLRWDGEAEDDWWFQTSKAWGSTDAADGLAGVKTHGFAMALGKEWERSENRKFGGFFGYGTTSLSMDADTGKSADYRLGVYGSWREGAREIGAYLNYGQQKDETKRLLGALGTAQGNYDSQTWETGVNAVWNLQEDKVWNLRPYAKLRAQRYRQDGYSETDAGVYNRIADAMANTYSTAQLGLELARKTAAGDCAFELGYRRVLGGDRSMMAASFEGNPGIKYEIEGNRQGKDFLIAGIRASGKLSDAWTAEGRALLEKSSRSSDLGATVTLRYCW